MVKQPHPISQVLERWRGRPCPSCGNPVVLIQLRVLASYTWSCEVCGTVLEALELYQDTTGHYFTENHFRAQRRDVSGKRTSWERLP